MHEEKLKALSERLLEREVLFKEDLIELLGPRAWEQEAKVSIGEKTVPKVVAEEAPEKTLDEVSAPKDIPESSESTPAPDDAPEQEGEVDENAA